MRPAAEIDVIVAGVIHGDHFVVGQVFDQFGLVFLILENVEGFGLGDFLAGPVFLALQNFAHLVFDGLEIGFGDGLPFRQREIVIEAVVNLRPDRVLGFGAVEFDHRLRQNVRQRVAIHVQYFVIHFVLLLRIGTAGQ